MKTETASPNGSARLDNKPAFVLPFLGVDHNSYRRVSINSAWTFRKTTGQADVALFLLGELIGELHRRSAKETPDLDALEIKSLLPLVQHRLEGVPEIAELPADDLARRQQLLRELAARKPTKTARTAGETAVLVVDEALAPIRNLLLRLVNESPCGAGAVIDSLQATLRDFSIPAADYSAYKRFANGVRALEMLARMANLPPRIRDIITVSIRKRTLTEFDNALEAHLRDYVADALRSGIGDTFPFLNELKASQATFSRNVAALRKHLEEHRVSVRQRNVQSRSSVLLELETPDQDQLLAGICDRHGCRDRAALTALFTDRLVVALNAAARARHPLIRVPASLTELFIQMPPRDVALGVVEVVADLIGDLHTVFTAARRFGVAHVASELYSRAAPLCSLASRDHVRLNIETHRDLIVRLPLPRGADDAEIAEQLRAAFRELHPACQFLTDATETEITAVRTLVGFPIGVEATNAAMLIDYAESQAQGHCPHLFRLLPESPDGKHVPELLILAAANLRR